MAGKASDQGSAGAAVSRGRTWTAVVVALCFVLAPGVVTLGLTSAAAQAATPTNGPLLYSGFLEGRLKTLGGTVTDLDFPVDPVAAFSPDGESLASVRSQCTDDTCEVQNATITIRHADGTSEVLPKVVGDVQEIVWSGDGAQLAVLVGYTDSEVWRLAVDGKSAPVKVIGTTTSFRVEGAGLDWNPAADQIAFVGTPLQDDGSSWAKDTRQLYTVAPTGGTPAQYSQVLPDCSLRCDLVEYSHPRFSPDGTRIAAVVERDHELYNDDGDQLENTFDEFLGVVTAGQPASVVRSIQHLDPPDSFSNLAEDGPIWSSDGARLLYSQYDDQGLDTITARVVKVTDGTVASSVKDPAFVDWQPCPTGTCAPWGTPPDDCTIRGTAGDDKLVGTAGRDVICGYEGDDVLQGNGGNDVLRGGPGQDQLIGGPGTDTLSGQEGPDVLRGDAGNDTLSGGADLDLVTYFNTSSKVTVDLAKQSAKSATQGTDKLIGIEGAFGSQGADTLLGSSSSNHLYGGPGADVLRGNGGTDLLVGNDGADQLFGGAGGDLLQGLGGKDLLNGGDQADACYDVRSGTTRKACELGGESDPPNTAGPGTGDRDGTVDLGAARARSTARLAGGGLITYWYIGNGDWLTVYDYTATQTLASWVSTPSWESQVCRFVRLTPARAACSAAGALNAVDKYQMKWFLWNAKRNGGCAIGILDWGHHGVVQFKKRWKTRSATYARYNVAVPYLSPGARYTYVKNSVGGSFGVRC